MENRFIVNTTFRWIIGGITAVLALPTLGLGAHQKPAPLFDGLGRLHHRVSTESREAQRYFDQGLSLCFAFNHQEAIRSFRGAANIDPDCAMAWWGVAYAYGPHVNKPMTREDNEQAWKALERAVALKDKAGPRDRAYIQALSKRYQAEFAEDRSRLDKAYAAAMRELVKDYPDDLDAQTLFAEALMDTMPWDYWAKDRSPKPETEEALAALRLVLKRDPDHPGANHFYIHAVEAGPNPELGLPAADRLAFYAPQAGHLVHMPSHIYMRVGQFEDAVAANERATKADRAYIRSCAAQGFYPGVYYPHNIHFLWFARLYQGRMAEALKAADQATRFANDNLCGPQPVLEAPRFRHLRWLTWARFGRWDDILAVPEPQGTNSYLVDRAMWRFSRGLAFAAKSQPDAVAAEHVKLQEIICSDELKKLENPQFPVTAIMAVADKWLAGKAAEARGDSEAAVARLREAVAAEDAIMYMEPPFWPIPARPALGAALLKAGQFAEAEAVFRQDLNRWPRNGWGLLGLEQSLRSQGKSESADLVTREFKESWKRADAPLQVAWF